MSEPRESRQAEVDAWNQENPGTEHPVEYWPGAREGAGRAAWTMEPAVLLGGHTPAVRIRKVNGGTDYIALTHVVRVPTIFDAVHP